MKHAASRQIRLGVTLMLGTALGGMASPAASGHPSLQGYWVSEQGPGGRGGPPGAGSPPGAGGLPRGGPGMGPPGPGGPPPGGRRDGRPPPGGGGGRPQASAAGVAAAKDYEQPYDDPAIKCDIANIIFGWTHDQNINEISGSGNTLTFKYGYMDFVRTIHMAGEHPKNPPLTRGGHSTGKWDGDTLVVDTVALAPSVLIPMAGTMLSDKAHVIERFTLEAGGKQLIRNYEVEDPLYLSQPYRGRDVMLASSEPYTPYDCVELSGNNNKRPGR